MTDDPEPTPAPAGWKSRKDRRIEALERRAAAEERIATALERLTEGLLAPEPPPPPEMICHHPKEEQLLIGINGPSWKCQTCGHIEWIEA